VNHNTNQARYFRYANISRKLFGRNCALTKYFQPTMNLSMRLKTGY